MKLLLVFLVTMLAADAQYALRDAPLGGDGVGTRFIILFCDARISWRVVSGLVAPTVDLSRDEVVKDVLKSAALFAQKECPAEGFNNIEVNLYRGNPSDLAARNFKADNTPGYFGTKVSEGKVAGGFFDSYPRAIYARNRTRKEDPTELTWTEFSDLEKARKEQQKRDDALKKQQETLLLQQRLAAEAQAKALALKTDALFMRAGSRQVVNLGGVCQNPFPYIGKTVIFPLAVLWTWRATSSTSAFLDTAECPFDLTGVPPAVLSPSFGKPRILAAKVVGRPQGRIMQLQYIYDESCTLYGCTDFPAIVSNRP